MKRPPAILPGLLGLFLLLAGPLAPHGAAYRQSGSQKGTGNKSRLGRYTPRQEQKTAGGPRPEADAQDSARRDPDLPPGDDNADKEDYMRRRNEYIARLRGYLPNRPFDPTARSRAIRASRLAGRQFLGRTMRAEKMKLDISMDAWTPVGPAPIPQGQTFGRGDPVSGRTTAIAVHPTNPKIVYAGTAAGGVYRSVNGGETWKAIFDEAESLTVGAIAVAPSRPSTVYVGTGEVGQFFGVGVYRIDNADGENPTLVGPINPLTDRGDGVKTPAFQQNAVSKILVHPKDPATIFVSTSWGVGGVVSHNRSAANASALWGVYRSTNATAARGSVAFTKLTVNKSGGHVTGDTDVTDMVMEPENPDVILCWVRGEAAADEGGVYRTGNALAAAPRFGQMHTTVTKYARGELAINKHEGDVTVLAATGETPSTSGKCLATEFGRLRRSTDGGRTWPDALTLPDADGFCGAQCSYDIAVEMGQAGASPAVIHVGGAGLFKGDKCASASKRSVDGGASFAANDTGLHADVHVFAVAPSNPSIVYTGNDGGIWKSTDGGASWVTLNNSDYSATQFVSIATHPTDREYMTGGTQDNGTELRRDDGSWAQIAEGDGGYTLIDTNAADTNAVTIYRAPQSEPGKSICFERVTTTAAAEMKQWDLFGSSVEKDQQGNDQCYSNNDIGCYDNVLFYAPMALGPGNPNTLYFGTDRLYRSADMGETMDVVGTSNGDPIRSFSQSGSNPPVVRTIPISSISVSPQSDNVRVVGLNNGEVWATTTGGALVNITPPSAPADVPVGRVFTDPADKKTAYVTYGGFGVASGRHVFKTTNLNRSSAWAAAGSGIPDVPVNAFAVDPSNSNHLYAGTDIGVYRSFDGGKKWVPFNEGLPRIPVFDMGFQGQKSPDGVRVLRIATHGRGIWEIEVGGGCQTRLTLSSSHAVTVGNTVSCYSDEFNVYQTDVSYWRAFNLASFGVKGSYNVTSVSFGVDDAKAGVAGATQPVTVRLYANNGGAFPTGTRKELASTTVQVADQTGKLLNVPLAAVVPSGTSELVMEVFTPDGLAAGNRFYIGTNAAAESGPSYMSAPFCSLNTPTDLGAIDLPDVHVVMKINGSCPAPAPPHVR